MTKRALQYTTVGLLLLAIAASGSSLFAEIREGSFEVELYGGYYDLQADLLDGDATLGGRFAYNSTQHFNFQANLGYTKLEQNLNELALTGEVEAELWLLDFSFGYHFMPNKKFVPEVNGGFGGLFATGSGDVEILEGGDPICGTERCSVLFKNLTEDSFTLNAGGGVKIDLGRTIYLRPLIRARYITQRDSDKIDPEYSLSIGFKIGGR
jgi:hypothetical protein